MRFFIGWIIMIGTMFSEDIYATVRSGAVERPLVVILMGPPGAGKGTQATTLSDHLGLPHIATGDLFRENIRNQTAVGKLAQSYIDQGKLVPDQVALDMLFERIGKSDCKQGYILDGFPRTVDQARAFDHSLQPKSEVIVLNLNVDDSVLMDRITGRLVCKGCKKPYHKKTAIPQMEGTCDQCGDSLYQREDDQPHVFSKRLEVYRNQTAPLISYYREKKLLLEIDARTSSEQVFREVLHALPHSLAGK